MKNYAERKLIFKYVSDTDVLATQKNFQVDLTIRSKKKKNAQNLIVLRWMVNFGPLY